MAAKPASENDQSPGDRIANVRAKIAVAATRSGRKSDDIKLIAVSKTQDTPAIIAVIEAGQNLFGENRVQESQSKWPGLKEQYPDVELHLIGPLQSNKAREAVALFDVIHTIDREKIARAIASQIKEQGRTPRLLIQVNTGEEDQKAGILPAEADAFISRCRDEFGLTIEGLMCIPPVDEEPALHFALLAKIADRNGLNELSMGMSADFETAIEQGATYVRVGTAIFGARG